MYAPIPSPRKPMSDVDTQIDCESIIDVPVRQLIDDIIRAGWAPEIAYAAIRDVVENQRLAYTADRDPVDDPAEGRKPIAFPLVLF